MPPPPPQVKAARDPAAVEAALGRLRASAALTESTGAGAHPANLLRLAVEAARVRATLGEISDALRSVWGEHKPHVSGSAGDASFSGCPRHLRCSALLPPPPPVWLQNAVVQGAYSGAFNDCGSASTAALEAEFKETVALVDAFAAAEGRRPCVPWGLARWCRDVVRRCTPPRLLS